MTDPRLPPSRFAAGHTVGGHPVHHVPRSAPVVPVHSWPAAPSPPIAAPEPISRLAIVSCVLAIALGPLAIPAAIPTALAAQRRCAATGERGVGLAKAAVFVSLAYLALTVVVAILWLVVGD